MQFIGTFYGIDFLKIKIHFQKCLHVLSKRSKQIKLDSLVIFFPRTGLLSTYLD